jgi:ubiquinone/menaquinone biosynthesis C-methylase UbiE
MLEGVRRRAEEAGVADRVTLCLADASGFQLEGAFDFALMFWMAHEVPDRPALFGQVRTALKSGGRLLLVEPKGHVGKDAFERTVGVAEQSGLVGLRPVPVPLSRAVLMGNPPETAVQ